MTIAANNPSEILKVSSSIPVPDSAAPLTKLSRSQRAFWIGLCIALLFCWSPSNLLGYVAPFAVWGVYVLLARKQSALLYAFVSVAIWAIFICVHALFAPDFAVPAALLTLITYSSFLIVPTILGKDISGPQLWNKTLKLLQWVVLLEGSLGIIQAVYGYTQTGSFAGPNGDHVEGTIHPALPAELGFSNPMFAVNMAFLLLALAPSVLLERKYRPAFLIGALALTLASVLHVLYLLFGAFLIAIVLYFPSILKYKKGLMLALAGVLFAALVVGLVGFRLDTARTFLRSNLEGRTPRGVVQSYAFNEMPREYPLLPLFGIGPGQFSSRAGLISSGLYFGRPERPRTVPFLPVAMSPAFRKYVLDVWLYFPRPVGHNSSSTHPYLSWLSVYVEFGGIVSTLVVSAVAYLLLSLRRYAKIFVLRIHTIALGTGILLLFLLGMQENYWEIPQAVFVGLLLLKLQYANLRARYNQLHR